MCFVGESSGEIKCFSFIIDGNRREGRNQEDDHAEDGKMT